MKIQSIKRKGNTIEFTGSFQRADLGEILAAANGILDLHTRLASDVFPNGVTLTCRECGHTISASSADCARYLAHGWPRHHGKEMRQPPD